MTNPESDTFMAMAARYASAFRSIFHEDNMGQAEGSYEATLLSVEVKSVSVNLSVPTTATVPVLPL